MHIILLPLVWTHLISASPFTLKPQVRHTLFIQPKFIPPWNVTECMVCYTGESLILYVLFGKDTSGCPGKMFSVYFQLKCNNCFLTRYEKNSVFSKT